MSHYYLHRKIEIGLSPAKAIHHPMIDLLSEEPQLTYGVAWVASIKVTVKGQLLEPRGLSSRRLTQKITAHLGGAPRHEHIYRVCNNISSLTQRPEGEGTRD